MNTKAIGARIKAAREARGLTQEDLASMIDLSATHMSVIERGVKAPRLETFIAIANALQVSSDTLLFDVIDCSTDSAASELSSMLNGLSGREKKKILKAIEALIT